MFISEPPSPYTAVIGGNLVTSGIFTMIPFKKFTLDNGLRVVVHEEPRNPMAVINIMYHVGSRDEEEDKTGFAHLFEHLMFGGSRHIPVYDEALQRVGGSNNAYTCTDVTNYYCTLPAKNAETAFWLESDRMLGLSFSPKVLSTQQKVVIEEFKERYLNQPYGDAWPELCRLAYTKHPYRWPTIGKEIRHIEQVTMQDVKKFFYQFYVPNNAVLVVAGGVSLSQVQRWCKKWFAPIPPGPPNRRKLPPEPPQKHHRYQKMENNVPLCALYKTYHVSGRLSKDFYATELLASILGEGKSSRLHDRLVDQLSYFNSVSACTTGSIDPGLLLISGCLNPGVTFEQAEKAIEEILHSLQKGTVEDSELEKAKNGMAMHLATENMDILHRSQELAMATLLGDTHLVNKVQKKTQAVTVEEVQAIAQQVLPTKNCSTIHYHQHC